MSVGRLRCGKTPPPLCLLVANLTNLYLTSNFNHPRLELNVHSTWHLAKD